MANVSIKTTPYEVNFFDAYFFHLWDITELKINIWVHRIAFLAQISHKIAISSFHMGYAENQPRNVFSESIDQ